MAQPKKVRPWTLRVWSREAVLLTALVALGVMFGVTEAAIGFYNTKQSQLAQMWFQRGTSDLAAKKPKEAIQDFRNALYYSPDDSTYQLRLAQAFAAADRIDAAESYLFDLWSREPGSGEINFELAQLEARKGNPDAARYFDNAIYGVWESNPEEHRWQARMQLFQFYRSIGNTGQAQAELLAMAADTPLTDYRRHTQIGRLQLEAGNPRQALQQFHSALRVNRRYGPALAGAGAAEFGIHAYQSALPYLDAAVRLDPRNHEAAAQLKMARLVIASDPFPIGLSERDRTERTLDAYLQALSSLSGCATSQNVVLGIGETPQNDLQESWAMGMQRMALMTRFHGQSQTVLKLMNFVFSAENVAANRCGPLQGKDQALWLIGRMHQLAASSGPGAD